MQERFCEEYLIDLNATAAYTRAGYAGNSETARRNAYKLLTRTDISTRVQQLKAERSERCQISGDKVLQALAALAFSKITDFVRFDERGVHLLDSSQLDPALLPALSSVRVSESRHGKTVSISLHDKVSVLLKLGEHLGLFDDLNKSLSTLKSYGVSSPEDLRRLLDRSPSLSLNEQN